MRKKQDTVSALNAYLPNAPVALVVNSPIGELVLVASVRGIIRICFGECSDYAMVSGDSPLQDHLNAAAMQLDEYFAGDRREFHVALDPAGTQFQQSVWQQARLITFGRAATYSDIAGRTGNPAAARAVGSALGANPVPLIIPCHRVIGANGSLTGFSGGLEIKRLLLGHESALTAGG